MASTLRDTVTPGHATSTTRPGVWLTELSLVAMALIWGVNFSVVKFGTTLVDPLAYNGLRVALAAVRAWLSIVSPAARRCRRGARSLTLLGLGVLGQRRLSILLRRRASRARVRATPRSSSPRRRRSSP